MSSRFEVHGAFELSEQGLFALTGEIADGMVQTGMVASLQADTEGLVFQERVHGVEYLELPGARGRPSLTFHYRDPSKLRRWMALQWEGRSLSLGF